MRKVTVVMASVVGLGPSWTLGREPPLQLAPFGAEVELPIDWWDVGPTGANVSESYRAENQTCGEGTSPGPRPTPRLPSLALR
jgi:hypothetical protein